MTNLIIENENNDIFIYKRGYGRTYYIEKLKNENTRGVRSGKSKKIL